MSATYLYITPFFPSPGNWRGAYCFDFVKALKRARPGLRIEVFVPGIGSDYEIDGIRVRRFKEKILKGFLFPFAFRRQNERSFLTAVERAGIKIEDVAICHGNTARFAIYPLAVKRLNPKCKTLLHHHDLASFGLNLGVLHKCALYNIWLFGELRKLHEQIDCHVFISDASRRSFLTAPDTDWTVYRDYKKQMCGPQLFRCRPVRIRDSLILHNGVDVELFKPLNAIGAYKSEEFVIGCIGNFDLLKGQIILLRAIGILNRQMRFEQSIKVVFVGSGSEKDKCAAYAKAHGIAAEFRSEVRHEALPQFYRSLDLFVLPSYFEGFGCVFTEAWACGTPFITCEGQGIGDLIAPEDHGKWLCKPRSPVDLADKIAGYVQHRWLQKLTGAVDMDTLVAGFVTSIGL